jgi:iron complex transport system substrate-binding protein
MLRVTMRMRMLVAGAVLAVVAGAADAAIRVTDVRGRVVVLEQVPSRIVSLVPSLTEAICALDACERLVGVDRFSNWPARIARLPRLGGLEDAQVERIVALRPDLVLASPSARVVERLENLGLKVLALQSNGVADMQGVLETVATALGRPGAGAVIWRQIDARIDAAAARVPPALHGRSVYFEIASTPHAAGEASFVGELLARLHLRNIVPMALGPFPQLNPEFVVRAQPAIVMASAANLAEMPRRPGWDTLHAVRERRVCGFAVERYEVIVRPGPRLGEAAETIAECLVALARDGR